MINNLVMYHLPLSQRDFEFALQAGLGRAVLDLQARGVAADWQLPPILDACVRDRSYDPQCECNRANWMLAVLDASGRCTELAPAIIAALSTAAPTWDLRHVCEVVAGLAARGHQDARRALYSEFERRRAKESWVGGKEIIELDGLDGLLFVAATIGRELNRDEQAWEDGYLISVAQEVVGADAPVNALRQASTSDPNVAAYLSRVERDSSSSNGATTNPTVFAAQAVPSIGPPPSPLDSVLHPKLDDTLAALDASGFGRVGSAIALRKWGKSADQAEIDVAADRLFASEDAESTFRLLAIFAERALCKVNTSLLRLVDDPDRWLANKACAALAMCPAPHVHKAGLERLAAKGVDRATLSMLTGNWRREDETGVMAVIRHPDDVEELHDIVYEIVHMHEQNKSAGSVQLWIWACEHSPCSNCRCAAAQSLHAQAAAPDWMRVEWAHDCYQMVRRLGRAGGV